MTFTIFITLYTNVITLKYQITDSSSYLSGKDKDKITSMELDVLLKSELDVSFTIQKSDLIEFANHIMSDFTSKHEEKKKDVHVTVNSACRQLNTTRMTLNRWNKTGYLKHIEVGSRRYYLQSDIDTILSSK